MNKIYLFFIINIISINLYSQNSIKGIVINDAKTRISYAVVINRNSNKGVLCDSLGNFSINAKIGDSLKTTCLGYNSNTYIIQSLKNPLEITLSTKIDTLEQVKIATNKTKEKLRVGIPKDAKIHKNSYFLPSESFLHAVCFNDIGDFKIRSLNIKMGYKGNNKQLPVRINLYTQSESGFPSKKLGRKDIIFKVDKYKWYKVVFEEEFIIPNNGICISFEPLIPSNNLAKFNKNNIPILGIYNSKEYSSFSLTNYTKWYKFPKGDITCPAIFLEIE